MKTDSHFHSAFYAKRFANIILLKHIEDHAVLTGLLLLFSALLILFITVQGHQVTMLTSVLLRAASNDISFIALLRCPDREFGHQHFELYLTSTWYLLTIIF